MSRRRRHFGTDGVRGRVGNAPMTPDFLVRLGYAIGRELATETSSEVLISKDTRRSGYMVESALEAGLSAAGVDVLLSGPLPTSAVAYLTPALRLSAGIVISASHNPHHDNGVKIFGRDGKKLADEVERRIEARIAKNGAISFTGEPGRANRLDAGGERYIEFCKRSFPGELNLRGMRIVVDCANGAAYHVAPSLFHELGAEVIPVGAAPDGLNINLGCGILNPQATAKTVVRERADIGVLLDGDADRIGVIDEKGGLHNGDAILFLIVADRLRRRLPVSGVVGTVLSNLALEEKMRSLGVAFHRSPVGDRYVQAEMEARDCRIGGEPSGHVILSDFHSTGDGVISALQVLRAMRETGRPLSDCLSDFTPVPQTGRDIATTAPHRLLAAPAVKRAIARAHDELGRHARLVVRASGTEPKIRLMVEGKNRQRARRVIDAIEAALKSAARTR